MLMDAFPHRMDIIFSSCSFQYLGACQQRMPGGLYTLYLGLFIRLYMGLYRAIHRAIHRHRYRDIYRDVYRDVYRAIHRPTTNAGGYDASEGSIGKSLPWGCLHIGACLAFAVGMLCGDENRHRAEAIIAWSQRWLMDAYGSLRTCLDICRHS